MKKILIVIIYVFATSQAVANVELKYPTGGESFSSGTIIRVSWKVVIQHGANDWDLYYSSDNGNNWKELILNIPANTLYYEWLVPDEDTSQGKLKIVQDNESTEYESISDSFSINYTTSSGNKLLIPDTLSGNHIDLTLQKGTHQFFESGSTTNTMGVNGSILGPTIILNKGEAVNIKVDNQLEEPSTIHWHGMHVAPENDGGPHTVIEPNTVWNPSFIVLDRASTYWYHPHLHEKTNEHVSNGISGFIIVRDSEEEALDLPRTYGVDDFPLAIQTKDFDDDNQIVVPSNSDDIVMVNATIDPVLSVPSQIIRLRLLNGSSMRSFNIGLNNNIPFHQIGSDGGLLTNPVMLSRLMLGPGERAEILVDCSGLTGQSLTLMSYASELRDGIYGADSPGISHMMTLDGYDPNPLNGNDFDILKLDITSPTADPVIVIPEFLVDVTPIPESDATVRRNLIFTPASMGHDQLNGDFLINHVSFDLEVINYHIPLGSTEIWSISNHTAIAHPFHIHDVQFYILDRNGNLPPASEQGLKDDLLIKPMETVRIITRFEDFANDDIPYMYHCHMLYHEDKGMMGQFIVYNTSTSSSDLENNSISIFPNPTNGLVKLKDLEPSTITIYNTDGKMIDQRITINEEERFDLSNRVPGIYFFKIKQKNYEHIYKVIKTDSN